MHLEHLYKTLVSLNPLATARPSDELRARICSEVEALPELPRDLIVARFGLDGGRRRTLEELVDRYPALTTHRAHAIEACVLHSLAERALRVSD